MNRFKNMVTFNVMQERWETPPDDDEEEVKHDSRCDCRDCQSYESDRYYDRMRDDAITFSS
jgi:hypothetical protein